MKVLFIYPNISKFSSSYHYGIGYLSAVLKKHGHETSLLHIKSKDITKDILFERITGFNPGLIAFSTTSLQYQYVKYFSEMIKKAYCNIPIICGGIHTTLCAAEIMSNQFIDYVCIGEGEYALLELCKCLEEKLDTTKIKNIHSKINGNIYKNPVRPLISDLDELPFPDRDFDDTIAIDYIAHLLAGRGCPFDCSYCCNRNLRQLYDKKGSFVRYRSVDNVLDEIETLVKRYNVKRLNFHDDTFTISKKWTRSFCEKYPLRFDLPYECNARVETVDREMLMLLKASGCDLIRIGTESGNEIMRQTILNRKMSNEAIKNICNISNEIGLNTYSFNMIGLPYETEEMINDTIELNKEINPTYGVVSIFYPYPNTNAYEYCKKENLLTQLDKESHFDEGEVILNPNLSEEKLNSYYRQFNNFFFEKMLTHKYPTVFIFYRMLKIFLGPFNSELFIKKLNDYLDKLKPSR